MRCQKIQKCAKSHQGKNLLGKVLEYQMVCQVWLLSLHKTNSSASWSSYSTSHMLFGLLTFPDWRLRRTPPPRRAKAEADRRTSRVRMFYLCSSMRTQLIWTGTYTTYHMPSGHLLTRELREENSFVPLVNCFAWFYIGKIVVIELLKDGNRFYFW